jgi:hypothetical protein
MNLHDRPWPVCVLGSTTVSAERLRDELNALCAHRFDHLDEQTAKFGASRLVYFRTKYVGFRVPVGFGLDDIEFKDRVPPYFRRVKGDTLIHYPVYFEQLVLGRTKCICISTPYEKVLRELTERLRSKLTLKFAAPAGDALAQYLENEFGKEQDSDSQVSIGEFKNVRIDLKTAELPLQQRRDRTLAADLRKVTLAGDNIFRSELYGRLRNGKADGNRYELSGALLTLRYRDEAVLGVATQLTDTGRYFLRPGYCGTNLISAGRLLGFFSAVKLLDFAKDDPFA